MKKPITVCESDPVLKRLFEQLDQHKKHSEEKIKFIQAQMEKIKFIQAQMEKIKSDATKEARSVWVQVEDHCKAMGRLDQDYDHTKTKAHLMREDGVLFFCDGDHADQALPQFLRGLFGDGP